ncbi:hypothetical protein SAMN05660479_03379 [Microbulbifer thermotolerans]|nr:hypothetical protein SAMN05660479_03379 [Microbulbifer thermotolerans]
MTLLILLPRVGIVLQKVIPIREVIHLTVSRENGLSIPTESKIDSMVMTVLLQWI